MKTAVRAFTIQPDTFGPTISSAREEGNVFDGPINRNGFSLRFSEPIDPDSLSVKLLWAGPDGVFGTADDEELAVQLSLSLNDRLLVVVPVEALPLGPVRLVLDGLTDVAGNATDAQTYAFTVLSGDVIWTNPAGGSWHDPTNWDPPIVPGEPNGATITLENVVVTITSPVTLHTLELGDGSAAGPVLLIERTDLTCAQAHIGNGATLRLEGLRASLSLHPASMMVSTSFENHALIELTEMNVRPEFGSPMVTLTVSDGTLVNAEGGTIRVLQGEATAASVPRVLAAELDNRGTPDAQWRLTIDKASAQHINAASGLIDITGGDLTVQQSGTTPTFTNEGDIQIVADRTMTINGGACANTGTITGPGTWNAPCAR